MDEKVLQFEKTVSRNIAENEIFRRGDKIAVALSGGADSVCLLHILLSLRNEFDFHIRAIHIEHGIRGDESLADAEFVSDLCEKMNVPLAVYHVDAVSESEKNGLSLEEAARNLRYRIFEEKTDEDEAVAVAHHADDNAETVLFQLVRGSGYLALCGMESVRGKIRRPLLSVSRAEIERYLRGRDISFRTDSTNADTSFSRNKIRNQILPLLSEVNEQAASHINRSAMLLRELVNEHEARLDEICGKCIGIATEETGSAAENTTKVESEKMDTNVTGDMDNEIAVLKRKETVKLSPFLQAEVIRRWLSAYAKEVTDGAGLRDISTVHIEAVRGLLTGASNRSVDLPHKICVYASHDNLHIRKQPPKLARNDK